MNSAGRLHQHAAAAQTSVAMQCVTHVQTPHCSRRRRAILAGSDDVAGPAYAGCGCQPPLLTVEPTVFVGEDGSTEIGYDAMGRRAVGDAVGDAALRAVVVAAAAAVAP
jgi:hypothetical protein